MTLRGLPSAFGGSAWRALDKLCKQYNKAYEQLANLLDDYTSKKRRRVPVTRKTARACVCDAVCLC